MKLEWERYGPTLARNREAARSSTTRRALAWGWNRWREWAGARGVPELPADVDAVELYLVAHLAEDAKLRWASIRTAAWAIDAAHGDAGLEPPGRDPRIRRALQGLRRRLETAPKQARALTIADIATFEFPANPIGIRDRALLLLGFAACLRRGELCALNMDDLEPGAGPGGTGLLVHIRRSKTDQDGAGARVYVAASQRFPGCCPVAAVDAWLGEVARHSARDGHNPALFRGVVSGHLRKRLCGEDVDRVVKRYAKAARLGPGFSGHSLRAGCATWLYRNGVSVPDIARHGRWKSLDQVLQYCRADTAAAVDGSY